MVRGLVLAIFLALTGAASAFGTCAMPQCIAGGGGAAMDNGSTYLHGTIGIPIVGLTSTATMVLHQGFWHSPILFSSDVSDPKHAAPTVPQLDLAPNPLTSTATLRLGIPTASEVTLKFYDVTGREIASLIEGNVTAGVHTAELDASMLTSGIYFCRLQSGSHKKVLRLVVTK